MLIFLGHFPISIVSEKVDRNQPDVYNLEVKARNVNLRRGGLYVR